MSSGTSSFFFNKLSPKNTFLRFGNLEISGKPSKRFDSKSNISSFGISNVGIFLNLLPLKSNCLRFGTSAEISGKYSKRLFSKSNTSKFLHRLIKFGIVFN